MVFKVAAILSTDHKIIYFDIIKLMIIMIKKMLNFCKLLGIYISFLSNVVVTTCK